MQVSEPSQIVLRNSAILNGKRILAVDSPGGELARALIPEVETDRVTLLHTDYTEYHRAKSVARELGRGRCEARFGVVRDADLAEVDVVVIYLPKGRILREFLFSTVADAMGPATRVLVTGPGRGGIKAAKKTLDDLFSRVEKIDSARHCVLYVAEEPRTADQSRRGLAAWGEDFEFEIAGEHFTVHSYPGVFSHGSLDDGTRMLLESLRTVPAGPVLDFGCGCGVIGAWIHRHWPQSLVRMVDTSAMAIEAAKRTAKIHGMPGDCVFVSDVFSNVNGQFDMIISNPSFQSGHRTDHETAERFLAAAGDHLNPDGILRLVADRFLPYRPLIERHVGRCRTVMEDERFRVYEAMRVFD